MYLFKALPESIFLKEIILKKF